MNAHARSARVFIMIMTLGHLSGFTARADWRQEAEERIAQLRMTHAEVRVIDKEGRPVPGVGVRLEMRRHAFLFGTAVNEPSFLAAKDGEPYRKHLGELFNSAVLENWMKWKLWERPERRGGADEIVAWLRARNFFIRGHTMIWQCPKFGVCYPADIAEAIKKSPDEPGVKDFIRQRMTEGIGSQAQHYRGKVIDWDVINELTEWRDITKFLSPETTGGDSPEMAQSFKTARQHDPGARLFINDYHILVGDYKKHKDDYEKIIEDLLKQGAPLGGIGMQGHFHGKETVRSPEQTLATLDRFARFKLPILITEFDAYGKGWGETQEEKEKAQAAFFEEFLVTVFSHPGVEGFLMWGFWDGAHWNNTAPLFRKDWTPKPGLEVWKRLVLDTWWTKEATATTGEDGIARLRVFSGEYRVRFQGPEAEGETTAWLTRESARQTFRLPQPRDSPKS